MPSPKYNSTISHVSRQSYLRHPETSPRHRNLRMLKNNSSRTRAPPPKSSGASRTFSPSTLSLQTAQTRSDNRAGVANAVSNLSGTSSSTRTTSRGTTYRWRCSSKACSSTRCARTRRPACVSDNARMLPHNGLPEQKFQQNN